ncbi:hypothetical protein NDU88_005654 [Pleurodeles waltl]|uniref:Uncharacterized protein n=1 Tax=Pleurodeles waltl TaxID=8319 RepID=A0AAV7VML5_PLEWA|nr:hypothetical protein NDU88_005654 [Pleurodeles waltl]
MRGHRSRGGQKIMSAILKWSKVRNPSKRCEEKEKQKYIVAVITFRSVQKLKRLIGYRKGTKSKGNSTYFRPY